MKRITLTFLTVLTSVTFTFGQITLTKVAPKVEQVESIKYDSLQNFLGKDVYKYIGQDLYLNGLSEEFRKNGYKGFSKDYTQPTSANKTNVFKCCDGFWSKYDEMVGKYFTVIEVMKHPKAEKSSIYAKTFYLKLKEKTSGDTLYFEYDSQFDFEFPFISVGYFTKLKQVYKGKEIIIKGKNWINAYEGKPMNQPMNDINTGKPISNFAAGTKWKCVDVSIEDKYFCLSYILQNEKGEKIPLFVREYCGFMQNKSENYFVFNAKQANAYKLKFGAEIWKQLLEENVKIGMTKEMCEVSWGKPEKINETITADKKSEQWVYPDNHFLYFNNNILTAIQ